MGHSHSVYRRTASNIAWEGFKSLPNEEPGLCEVVHVEDLTVTIISEPDAYMIRKGAIGYAYCKDDHCYIVVLGTVVDGHIIMSQPLLGHEFKHILNAVTKGRVINPDKMGDL